MIPIVVKLVSLCLFDTKSVLKMKLNTFGVSFRELSNIQKALKIVKYVTYCQINKKLILKARNNCYFPFSLLAINIKIIYGV